MTIQDEAMAELHRAEGKFAPFNSAHEGLAVLREEYLELEKEVFWGTPQRQREEAIQVAAMALRFVNDIVPLPEEPTDD